MKNTRQIKSNSRFRMLHRKHSWKQNVATGNHEAAFQFSFKSSSSNAAVMVKFVSGNTEGDPAFF